MLWSRLAYEAIYDNCLSLVQCVAGARFLLSAIRLWGGVWLGLLIALPFMCLMATATSLAGGAMGIVQPAGVERPLFAKGSSVHPGRMVPRTLRMPAVLRPCVCTHLIHHLRSDASVAVQVISALD
jgi:hypothetical protein